MRIKLLITFIFLSAVCFGQDPVPASNNQSVPDDGKVGAWNPTEVKGDHDKVGAWHQQDVNDTPKVKAKKLSSADSLLIPVFSTKEVLDYLVRINNKALAIKELELSGSAGYEKLVAELNKIIAEMDKKRKGIK